MFTARPLSFSPIRDRALALSIVVGETSQDRPLPLLVYLDAAERELAAWSDRSADVCEIALPRRCTRDVELPGLLKPLQSVLARVLEGEATPRG